MPAPDLSGYVTVPERIAQFRELYKAGCLRPVNPEKPYEIITIGEKTFIVYAAAAYRNAQDLCPGIGIAWEPFPGRTPYTKDSELMNAETSAWGRAIVAVLAADTNAGIATREEIQNRSEVTEHRTPPKGSSRTPSVSSTARASGGIKDAQELVNLAHVAPDPEDVRNLYKLAGTNGWLKHAAVHPVTGESLTVEDFLTTKGNDLKHSKSG